jgi:hypothetical protein
MPNPITGQPWPWEPQPKSEPTTDHTARDMVRDSLQSANGGLLGAPSPVTVMGTGQQANTPLDTGYSLYTFANNSSIEINDKGETRNYKAPPASATSAQAPANVAAKSGQLIMPNGQVYIKNPDTTPGAPPYILDTNTQNNQQIETAKSVAATNASQAQAALNNADAQLKLDPTNIALQQAKDAAAAKLSGAQADAATLNAASTANRVGAQNTLDTAQAGAATSNAASTAQNAQSTAARVLAQNQLDMAQAKSASTSADVAAGRLPSQIGLDVAQANNQNAAATAALQKANEPTTIATGTGPTYTYYDPKTGQMVSAPNTAYVPTDPGRMTVQLKQQADAQWQTLQQQVAAGKITGDQAASQFNQFWDASIEPMKGDIAAAQAKAQSGIDLTQSQAGYYQAQAANLPATLAQNASSDAQKNLISMLPYVVGKGAASSPGITSGANGYPKMDVGQIMQNATYSLPNLQEVGRQGAAAALANFSPTAAMHAQMPGPPAQPPVGGMPDLSSMLNMNNYTGGAPQQGMPSPAAAPAQAQPAQVQPVPAAAAGGGPQQDWVSVMARLNQDRADQARQAQMGPIQPPTPGLYNPYYQQQAVPAAGMPATGPIAGAITPWPSAGDTTGSPLTGASVPWGWPPYQPSS